MVRRITRLFLVLLMLGISAHAEEEARLPQAVIDLCASVHPGYEIAKHDGWGDENCGQLALILKQGEDNILCIAEKTQDDPAYRLTVDNTNAVYDGDVLPGLLIDTGGDALFYTYHDINGHAAEQYHTDKDTGEWSPVDVTVYLQEGDEYHSILSGVSDGMLRYQHHNEDELGNIFTSWEDAPIAVNDAFEKSLLPQHFNIDTFVSNPEYGFYPMFRHEAFARSRMMGEHKPVNMDISPVHVATMFDMADGGSLLHVEDWDGTFCQTAAQLYFAGEAALDSYHSGEGVAYVGCGRMSYSIRRSDIGCWYLEGVDAANGVSAIGPDYAAQDGQITVYRNDGYIYGESPWGTLGEHSIAIDDSYEEMAARLHTAAYALVNNPNPADRLHLRARPDKGSHSYGKFYNRTPVLVLERGETWTRVQIGRGRTAMTGYMMTKFLAFDEKAKAELACAFPQKMLLESHPNGVHMYAEPKDTAVMERMFQQSSDDFIIGVSGDEWYIVLRADGAVGYVPQRAFWDGNG